MSCIPVMHAAVFCTLGNSMSLEGAKHNWVRVLQLAALSTGRQHVERDRSIKPVGSAAALSSAPASGLAPAADSALLLLRFPCLKSPSSTPCFDNHLKWPCAGWGGRPTFKLPAQLACTVTAVVLLQHMSLQSEPSSRLE